MATNDERRSVSVIRVCAGRFQAANARGGVIEFGSGEDADFTPVELLLAAIAGCSGIDVDILTTRRAEPDTFQIAVAADKVRDESGNRLSNVEAVFSVRFPEGADGDAARALLPTAIRKSHERLCTVSRTVELATPVSMRTAG